MPSAKVTPLSRLVLPRTRTGTYQHLDLCCLRVFTRYPCAAPLRVYLLAMEPQFRLPLLVN